MAEARFTGSWFYDALRENKLLATRCQSCSALHLPPRDMCPACYGDEMEIAELTGDGTLMAFTTIHIAPTAMMEAGYGRHHPYCVGIVQLQEGPSISTQIVGVDPTRPEEIEIGTPLRTTFVERGEGEDARTYLAFQV
jgi:uncharacterized OB-fold protein